MKPLRAAVLLATVLTCGVALPLSAQGTKPVAPASAPLRVLFVGNSYLFTHNIPAVVADVAAARGKRIVAGMLAEPNFNIADHLARSEFERRLDQGWDWVVMHQGPSSLPESQIDLRTNATRAAALARARGIKVALMSAWPALQNAHTWANAELSYRNAATAIDACVLPVATAWRYARERDPNVRLYQSDQLHPEREGSLLAALVMAEGLIEGPLFTGPLNLGSTLGDNEWRQAVNRGDALHVFARDALSAEGPRCMRAK
jgi:hypothetical protein